MSDNVVSFDKIIELGRKIEETGLRARWEARAEVRGKKKEALAIAQNMVKAGFPPETVISMTNLNAKKVKSLYKAAGDN